MTARSRSNMRIKIIRPTMSYLKQDWFKRMMPIRSPFGMGTHTSVLSFQLSSRRETGSS